MRTGAVSVACAVVIAASCAGRDTRAAREAAYRENNQGVAALEQYAYDSAVEAFRRAIALDAEVGSPHVNLAIALYFAADLDAAATAAADAVRRMPESPHAHFVLGLIARSQGRLEEASAAFERVLAVDADDPGALVNLGQIDLQARRVDQAVARFRRAAAREPFNATATYALGQALLRSGAAEEGTAIMTRFETLRESGAAIIYSQVYLEHGRYAEALLSTGLEPDLVDPSTPRVRFTDVTAVFGFTAGREGPQSAAKTPGVSTEAWTAVTVADLGGDGAVEVVLGGTTGVRVFRWNGTRFEPVRDTVADVALREERVLGIAAADLDNDARTDLLLLRERGLSLLRQETGGRFVPLGAPMEMAARLRTAAVLDADHDGDLDVMAGGERDGAGMIALFQNDGEGRLSDVTASARLTVSGAVRALVPTDFDNGRDIDVLALVEGHAPTLFANQRDGSFRDLREHVGLVGALQGVAVAACDVNKDGRPDFFVANGPEAATMAMSDLRDRFVLSAGPPESRGLTAAQCGDYDNDGLLDVIGTGPRGLRILRNVGGRLADVTQAALGGVSSAAESLGAFALGDLDGDGDVDVLTLASGGALHVFRNDGASARPSLAIGLKGLVSNRSGVGAKVDVRAGSLSQRLELIAAIPPVAARELLVGLGARERADVVRVLWPAGIVQAETAPADSGARSRLVVSELNRKPSSCPYLYSWNGRSFEFVTDFLGGGEMGYWTGPHGWNAPDGDEFVRMTGSQLTSRDGRLDLRVTNELEEVLYLDHLELFSVDHPPDVEVYPREGMRAVPAKGLSLAAVRNVRPLPRVVTDRGEEVTTRVARPDGVSAEGFVQRPIRGYAEPHAFIFEVPRATAGPQVLLLTAWTDYAFSSDNVSAAQRGWVLEPPRLDIRSGGGWRPLVADVGIPVGRPQTVVVDIGRAASAGAITVRLSTTMQIHWDAFAVADVAVDVRLLPRAHGLEAATLAWRGFSAERAHGKARIPDYSAVSAAAPWKVAPGRYTREGDVKALLDAADDLFVVAQPGDEVALAFRDGGRGADSLRVRTYLLRAVGFSKEMDLNSSGPFQVLPLPYAGMTSYPPPPPPAAVWTRQREMLERYNTRVVTRSLPPLVEVRP
ncbi:MAG: FG-GAP-like repeat-containing protein [Acidobacteriota bacterium]